jgi:hypothetical protein
MDWARDVPDVPLVRTPLKKVKRKRATKYKRQSYVTCSDIKGFQWLNIFRKIDLDKKKGKKPREEASKRSLLPVVRRGPL